MGPSSLTATQRKQQIPIPISHWGWVTTAISQPALPANECILIRSILAKLLEWFLFIKARPTAGHSKYFIWCYATVPSWLARSKTLGIDMTGIRAPKPSAVVGNSHAKPVAIRKRRQKGEKKITSWKSLALSRNKEAFLQEPYLVSYIYLNLTLHWNLFAEAPNPIAEQPLTSNVKPKCPGKKEITGISPKFCSSFIPTSKSKYTISWWLLQVTVPMSLGGKPRIDDFLKI